MNKILENKVILVTGGNGLIGKVIVEDIKKKGGIAITADINVNTDLEKEQIKCDITSFESMKNALNVVIEHYGKLDGLVNNAYPRTADWGTDFLDMTETNLKTNVDWQMNSYILFCQLAIKAMLAKGSGSIVNIASIYGVVGNDFTIYEDTNMKVPAPYAAVKGGIINFSRFLASRFGKDGIRVNVVSPGGIFDNQPKSFVDAYEKKVPLKRMGNPEDIAPTVSFLLSKEAQYITGHNLIVDGGWTII
jgi:NAD(P)-dependent dehydrogenase (short-subunit alcohol dehydrogenase family)